MSGQRPIQPGDCCGLTATARESGMRALSQATHPLPGQVVAGNARERHPRHRIRPLSWWERNRRERPRTVSRAAHATVVASNHVATERIRTPSQAAPADAIPSGRSSRPSGAVPPNQRMQPDAVPASEIGPIFRGIMT
jgi:hypothetical protein